MEKKFKAKEYQKKLLEDTYNGLLRLFNEEAIRYRIALLKTIDRENLSRPMGDDFFRSLAFDAFVHISKKEVEGTLDTIQMYENIKEAQDIINDTDD